MGIGAGRLVDGGEPLMTRRKSRFVSKKHDVGMRCGNELMGMNDLLPRWPMGCAGGTNPM